MANKKKLGIYWGNSALFFVETQETEPKNIFQIPLGEAIKNNFRGGPAGSNAMALESSIKKVLSEKGLLDSSANLSLPAKDIIFRPFVIPWMEKHEIQNVVEF